MNRFLRVAAMGTVLVLLALGLTLQMTVAAPAGAPLGQVDTPTPTLTPTLVPSATGTNTATATSVPMADLSVSLNATAGAYSGGPQQIAYNVVVTNSGALPSGATSVTVSLPSGTTYAYAISPCTFNGSLFTCQVPGLTLGQSVTYSVGVSSNGQLAVVNATATVDPGGQVGESNESNNAATSQLSVSATGLSSYLYASTPCSTSLPPNCNPQYPNATAVCTPSAGYTCTANNQYGTSTYLYASSSCSSSPAPNCNPQYPNSAATCTPNAGYTCTNSNQYGMNTYLYANSSCSTSPAPNCNPQYPNTSAICTPGAGYTCNSSSGCYAGQVNCTGYPGNYSGGYNGSYDNGVGTITSLPDLIVSLSADLNPSAGPRVVDLNATVRNRGSGSSAATTLSIPVPAGSQALASSAGCTFDGARFNCAVPALAASQTVSFTASVTANNETGNLVSTATVDPNQSVSESDNSNNSGRTQITLAVAPPAQVAGIAAAVPVASAPVMAPTVPLPRTWGWLRIASPTQTFSHPSMEPMWMAEPGELYSITLIESGWALAVWERDSAFWTVWISLDASVQQLSLEREPFSGADTWLLTSDFVQTYGLDNQPGYVTGLHEWYRMAVQQGGWALVVWEGDQPNASTLVWMSLDAGVVAITE